MIAVPGAIASFNTSYSQLGSLVVPGGEHCCPLSGCVCIFWDVVGSRFAESGAVGVGEMWLFIFPAWPPYPLGLARTAM